MTPLKILKLNYFRNYTQLLFSPSARTLIIGDNGQGKTNLLEALVLVAGGRSFRPSLPESLVQRGEEQAFLSAELWKENKKFVLNLSLDRSGKKQFLLNEKKTLGVSLAQVLPVILFSPESLSLLKGGAEQRRIYMDEWLNMLGHSFVVREFKKALLQKNRFLKENRLSLAPFNVALWESVNTIFIEKSWRLSEMREKALADLSDFGQQTGAYLFAGATSSMVSGGLGTNQAIEQTKSSASIARSGWLGTEGQSTENKGHQPYLPQHGNILIAYERKGLRGTVADRESHFRNQVWAGANKEKLAGVSLYGAHRDDFVLSLNGQDSRYFCSQGQQRGLILALKMAQVLWLSQVLKTSPLLLLDDIFSEIDDRLLSRLLQFLEGLPVQTILTSTREPLFLNSGSFQKLYLNQTGFEKDATLEAFPSYK